MKFFSPENFGARSYKKAMWIVAFAFLLSLSTRLFALEVCPPATVEEVEKFVGVHGTERLIFFSSWCASCSVHLKTLEKGDVLVGVFDEQGRIEAVLGKLGIRQTCFYGDQIAKHYGVRSLPAIKKIR